MNQLINKMDNPNHNNSISKLINEMQTLLNFFVSTLFSILLIVYAEANAKRKKTNNMGAKNKDTNILHYFFGINIFSLFSFCFLITIFKKK